MSRVWMILCFVLVSCATDPRWVTQPIEEEYNSLISVEQEKKEDLLKGFSLEKAKESFPDEFENLVACYQKKGPHSATCQTLYEEMYFLFWISKIENVTHSEVNEICKNFTKDCQNQLFKASLYLEYEKIKLGAKIETLESERDRKIEEARVSIENENYERRQRLAAALMAVGQGLGSAGTNQAQINTFQSNPSCYNDYSCGFGKACVKANSYDGSGICMKVVNQYGNQDYSYKQKLQPTIAKECLSSADCPTFWRCEPVFSNSYKKSCVK